MKKMKKLVFSFLVIMVAVFSFHHLIIAEEWDAQTIDEVDKVWKVDFNLPLESKSLTAESIYVTDGSKKHPTSLRLIDNGHTVHVSPDKDYEVGKSYMLMITTLVKTKDGNPLKTPVEVPFKVDPNAKIHSISAVSGGIVTNITVKTSSDVHKVKVGTYELHYNGNNTFSYGLLDVKAGTIFTVYAYDENDKLIESQKYTVRY